MAEQIVIATPPVTKDQMTDDDDAYEEELKQLFGEDESLDAFNSDVGGNLVNLRSKRME